MKTLMWRAVTVYMIIVLWLLPFAIFSNAQPYVPESIVPTSFLSPWWPDPPGDPLDPLEQARGWVDNEPSVPPTLSFPHVWQPGEAKFGTETLSLDGDANVERAMPAYPQRASLARAQDLTADYVYTDTSGLADLNSYDCSTPAVLTLDVGDAFIVGDVDVGLNLRHERRGEISITLQSPAGTLVPLIQDPHGQDPSENYDVRVDDVSPNPRDDGDDDHVAFPYYERTIAPVTLFLNTGGLNAFEGEAAAGAWRLYVCDRHTSAHDGDLKRWSLFFREPAAEFDRFAIKAAPYQVEAGDVFTTSEVFTYAVYLHNSGSLTASHVLVSDSLPSGVVQYAPATFETFGNVTSILSDTTDPVTWLGSIPPLGSLIARIPAQVTASGSTVITNTAVISDPALETQVSASTISQVYATGALYYYMGINYLTTSAKDYTTAGSWLLGGNWGAWMPYIGPPAAHSGLMALGTNIAGAYDDHSTSVLRGVFDLTAVPLNNEVTLQWWEWLDMAPNDAAYVEIASATYPTPTLLYGQYVGGLTTEQAAHEQQWYEVQHDLTRYRGQVVTLTFTLQPDGDGSTAAGWYLDDIGIHLAPGRPNLEHSRKVATPSIGQSGRDFTYTLYLHNSGPVASISGYMVDLLPDGVSINAVTLSGPGTLTTDTHQITWRSAPADPLPAGQTATVTVQAYLDWGIACGTRLTNTATITDAQAASTVTIRAPMTVYRYGGLIEHWELEADDGSFVPGSVGEWEWGAPDPAYPRGPRHAHSGRRVWGTDLDADARGAGAGHTLTRTLALPDDPKGLYLGWWDWFDEDGNDARHLWINGTLVWSNESTQPYWAFQRADLTAWAGETVELAFELDTCCSDPGPAGWYIDDISLYADCPRLELAPQKSVHTCPGGSLIYALTLKNATEQDDFVALAVSHPDGQAWPAQVVPTELFLDPGARVPLTVSLNIPWTVDGGTYGVVTLTARTQNGRYDDALRIEALADIGSGWKGAADTVGARYHGLAYHDGSLYQIGGETDLWLPIDAVYRYDIATNSWSPRTALPTALSGVDAVTLEDRIYVPGGSDDTEAPFDGGTFLDSLHIYDPATNAWSTGAAMPVPLAFASAVALDGKLYVMGGERDNGSYSDALYIYDPTDGSWTQGAFMSETRAYAGAGVIDGQIYIAGGYAGEAVTRDSLEIYDPATDTWRVGPQLPIPLASPGSGVVDDRYLVLIGGGAMDIGRYRCSSDAWAFDSMTGRWFPLPTLNRCLYGTAVTGDGTDLYLVSGRTNEGGWHMAAEVEPLARCAALPDAGWTKKIADTTHPVSVAWTSGLTRTVYAGDRLMVTDAVTSAEAFTLSERWDPNHLTLMTYTLTPPGTGQVVPGGAWRVEPAAPFAYSRSDAEYSAATGLVYILGGRLSSQNDTGRIWAFDPQTGVYTDTGTDMPAAVTNYVIARLTDAEGQEALVIFGGYIEDPGTFIDDVQVYYPESNSTALLAADPLPVAAIPGGVAVVDNKAYVFGGTDGGATVLDETYIFDITVPAGSRWSVGPPMNRGRRYIPNGVVDGVIYALGGNVPGGGGLIAVTTTERLDTSAGSPAWDEVGVAPMPIACDEAPAFGFDTTASHALVGSVVIAGCGHWSDESGLSLRYDAVHDQWDLGFPGLNRARRNHAGALVPSSDGVPGMWVWGGRQADDFNILDEPEHYVLSELDWTVAGAAGDPVTFTKYFTVASGLWAETEFDERLWIRGGVYENRPVSLASGDRYLIYLPLVLRD